MTTYVESMSTTYPYQAVVRVISLFADGYLSSGSGVVVGPNDVLTASHMVYDVQHGAATQIGVAPGYDNGNSPYGIFYAQRFNYYEWDADRDNLINITEADEDIAILGFAERLSDKVGSFALDPYFSGGAVHATGYPGKYAGPNGFKMTDDTGTIYSYNGLFYNNADVELNPGNSGGPIWYQGANGPSVVGVVSTGLFGPNIATHFSELMKWISGNDDLLKINSAVPDLIKQVARLYEAGLDRRFDTSGLNFWIDKREAGMQLNDMAREFLDSSEFTIKYGDDDQMAASRFIDVMYKSTLGRSFDQDGFAYWNNRMNSGMTREDVLLNFSESPENVAQSSYLDGLQQVQSGYWDIMLA